MTRRSVLVRSDSQVGTKLACFDHEDWIRTGTSEVGRSTVLRQEVRGTDGHRHPAHAGIDVVCTVTWHIDRRPRSKRSS